MDSCSLQSFGNIYWKPHGTPSGGNGTFSGFSRDGGLGSRQSSGCSAPAHSQSCPSDASVLCGWATYKQDGPSAQSELMSTYWISYIYHFIYLRTRVSSLNLGQSCCPKRNTPTVQCCSHYAACGACFSEWWRAAHRVSGAHPMASWQHLLPRVSTRCGCPSVRASPFA